MLGVNLREARCDEGDHLFQRYRETTLVAYAHIFPPELYPFPDAQVRELWRALVSESGTKHRLLVAEVDGQTAGAVTAAPGRLEHLFVVPACWGRGVADALLAAAIQVSREASVEVCRLEVLEQNLRARRFYERHGWFRDDRSRVADYPPHPVVVGYTLHLHTARYRRECESSPPD